VRSGEKSPMRSGASRSSQYRPAQTGHNDGVAERGADPLRADRFADRAQRPVRRNPFPGGMCQQRGQPDLAGFLVNRGGLDGRDLVATERLAHDMKPAGERSITEAMTGFPGEGRADGGDQRFFRIGQFTLGFGNFGTSLRNNPRELIGAGPKR
jgi:hypothetical protein